MYEHRRRYSMAILFQHCHQLFVCIRKVVQGEPLGMEISGAQGICRK